MLCDEEQTLVIL